MNINQQSYFKTKQYYLAGYQFESFVSSFPKSEKAQEALQDIFDRMQIIAENVDIDPTNFGSVAELNKLWNEYQRLHNLYDVNGMRKQVLLKI